MANHRREPSDFVLLKAIMCSMLEKRLCNRQMRITIMDWNKFNDESFLNEAMNSSIYDSYVVTSYNSNFTYHLGTDEHIEHSSYFLDDRATEDLATKFEKIVDVTTESKVCNDKGVNKARKKKQIVVEKRPTMFSVYSIIADNFIKKKMIPIYFVLFASQNSDCAIPLNELLIFMTAVNFDQGTYIISNKMFHSNISVIQHFDKQKVYITEDGESFIENWKLFRLPFYILYLIIFEKIWRITGKLFEAKPSYRFTCTSFSTYIVNPLLISPRTPLMHVLGVYFVERVWLRKLVLIGGSFVTTLHILILLPVAVNLIYVDNVVLIAVFFNCLLIILFVIECVFKCLNKCINFLPENLETFELCIFISPMFMCLMHSVIKMSSSLFHYLAKYDSIAELIVFRSKHKKLILLFELMGIFTCATKLNDRTLPGITFVLASLSLFLDWSNIVYWVFRSLLCFVYFALVYSIMNCSLQFVFILYYEYAEWLFSIQVWIPLIFLCLSYVRDLINEYDRVYKQCLQAVVTLINSSISSQCINAEYVAILSTDDTLCDPTLRENRRASLKAMLFYDHGVPYVTSKLYFEIKYLLNQVLETPLSMKRILIKEMKSIFFRMLPVIITSLVINTSDLSFGKSEPVYKFLISSILFLSYSKLFLQRATPNIDIHTNSYFKTKLQLLIRQFKEEFDVTNVSKQKVRCPEMSLGMMIITWITVFFIAFLSIQNEDNVLALSSYAFHSRFYLFLQGYYFTVANIYLWYFLLITG